MKKLLLANCLILLTAFSVNSQIQVYELRVYEMGFSRSVELLHNYFDKALIPALNRQGAKNVGAFEEVSESLPRKIYLLIPHQDILHYQNSENNLFEDKEYLSAANPYLTADQVTIPFKRINANLIQSTKEFPELIVPKNAGIYELRIYESHNEGALKNKLKMFEDEFAIFAESGLPMVFYGKNISGDQMPCLTYMLANTDLNENKLGWSKFINHPTWKKLTTMDQYKGNMSNITRVYLKPLKYSQI